MNGGPLTLEFDKKLFGNDESCQKMAQLVKLFIVKGGHQLQLNVVDADTMREAQKHPEGLSPQPELMVKEALCDHCGRCRAPCSHSSCRPFARYLHACPKGLVSVCGQEWEVEALAKKLKTYSDLPGDGGITFSGGEPLLQAEFIEEVCDRLPGLHKTLQTNGFAAAERFKQLVQRMDYLLFDLKLADPTAHIAYVGQSNEPILRNFNWLKTSGLPFTVRIPLIPGITDTADNLKALAAMTRDAG